VYGALVWWQGKNVQDCSNKLFQKSVLRDCIFMCFDICAINIRVSIPVRGLHLVFSDWKLSKNMIGEYSNMAILFIFGLFTLRSWVLRSWRHVADWELVVSNPHSQPVSLGCRAGLCRINAFFGGYLTKYWTYMVERNIKLRLKLIFFSRVILDWTWVVWK